MTPFFDRNFGSRVPNAIRLVGQTIKYHDDEAFPQDLPDTEVIRRAAANNWVIFTRDKKIRRKPAELDALKQTGAKCVVLAQRSSMRSWELLQRVVCSWDDIEKKLSASSGPVIINVYKDGRLKTTIL